MNVQLSNFQTKFCTFRNALILFLSWVLVVTFYIVLALHSPITLFEGSTFEINEGDSVDSIMGWNVSGLMVVTHPIAFKLYVMATGKDKQIKAGTFTFPKEPINLIDLAYLLTSGVRPKEIKFTIPEGYTLQQIAELLADKNVAVNVQVSTKEGYLFPDTYRVYEGASADEIIQKMLDNFKRKVDPLLPEIENQGKTLEQVIIMASILEREVQREEDMRLVSDILWRRLDGGIKLEVDSTLNYVLPKEERREALTFFQLAIDSPYNTYKYSGLPPTPIGNPGLKAIKAAINPDPNDYWYYLSASDGAIVYAKTFDEQRRNKKEYLN